MAGMVAALLRGMPAVPALAYGMVSRMTKCLVTAPSQYVWYNAMEAKLQFAVLWTAVSVGSCEAGSTE